MQGRILQRFELARCPPFGRANFSVVVRSERRHGISRSVPRRICKDTERCTFSVGVIDRVVLDVDVAMQRLRHGRVNRIGVAREDTSEEQRMANG